MPNYSYSEIDVAYLANGFKLSLPVHVLSGSKDGPTVGISASVHGDEIIGVEIIRQTIERLKDREINGRINFMSVANPLAFEDLNRNTPLDYTNLNRVFPGNKDGNITEITAYKMTKNYLTELDYYIDLHAGGAEPIVDYVYILNDEEMSRAFGSKVLYKPKKMYEGTTASVTLENNIPSVTVELGGGPNYREHIERGIKGVFNILKNKNIIPGEASYNREEQITVDHIENITPHHGGLCVPSFDFTEMNNIIEGRQTLAKIYNPKTLELVEEIKAPFDQNLVILMRGNLTKVQAGDYSFMIGKVN